MLPVRSDAALPGDLAAELEALLLRGTPANTLRAWRSDLAYIAAWKRAALGAALAWPEAEAVALRFVLDHARDLAELAADDPARRTAETLLALGLRRGLARPAPATLDRRIATWRAFHRMRNLPSPFDAPLLREARIRARRAARHRPAPRSAHPVTRDVLEALLATCGEDAAGLRDRALLMLAWASGGRRRSEIAALRREDLGLDDLAARGIVWIDLPGTKTTEPGATPRLLVKGRAAEALAAWIAAGAIVQGPLFRPVSAAGRVLARPLSAEGVRDILRRRLALAGFPQGFASPHGLRSGFLTEAARAGSPVQAAMRLSLHRSARQAMAYYADVELAENPATDLLG